MRSVGLFMPFLLVCHAHAQLLVNEVQCAPGDAVHAGQGQWIELYNAGPHAVELYHHVLSVGPLAQTLPQGVLRPGEFRVFACGGGAGALDLKLPRTGGAVLLLAPGGSQVLDVFRWPALPQGVSMGRFPDGARQANFFSMPTPGALNQGGKAKLLPPPDLACTNGSIESRAPEGVEVRYTLDGSTPGPNSALLAEPLRISGPAVVRARAFAADAVPGTEAVLMPGLPEGAWGIAVDPQDLAGPNGLADMLYGNHARKGKAWTRQAFVAHNGRLSPVGLSVAGSGSRGLPKRNFKLTASDRYGSVSPMPLPKVATGGNILLRADATPHAFLRNLFMEQVVERSGARVDVQASTAAELYINGRYHGLYRAMPTKGKGWLRGLAGGNAVELVTVQDGAAQGLGPGPYAQAVQALVRGMPADSLNKLMELQSLVEMACLDLWTGRVDHELNVRAWRPTRPGGRWRWVLYDMDSWATPEDRTVARMMGEPGPLAPFLQELLSHGELQEMLLARMAALCATVLSPRQAAALSDSLYRAHAAAMEKDHGRWADAMPCPLPRQARNQMLEQAGRRSAVILPQLAAATGRTLQLNTVQVEPAGAGQVELDGLPLAGDHVQLQWFRGVRGQLHAIPAAGMEFAGWKGLEGQDPRLEVGLVPGKRVVAVFRPAATAARQMP